MGHASLSTTKIYRHHAPKHDAAQRFTAAFGPAEQGTLARSPENAGLRGASTRSRDAIIMQAMTNLLVRDLPDDVHRALQRRAKLHGQSLQQYLSSELTRIAKRPSLAEVLDRIDRKSGGEVGLARAAKDLAEERERR
jgi:plasmid stability protein